MGRNERSLASSQVSFHEIAAAIVSGNYLDILENPSRPNQDVFVINITDYTWVVPFVMEDEGMLFLKTAYPSRKMHRRY